MWLQLEIGDDKQHQAHSAPSDVDMNTREQTAAIKKTVVENATRELVLEHACELVETFPISKEKALILSVIRSWDSLDSITKKKVNDRIKATSEVDLDLIGGSSEIDEVFSLIFQSGEKKIPDWFHLLWSGSSDRKSSMDDVEPLVKAASSFYKCDQEAVSVLRHAIDSKSALCLVINEFVDEHSNQIVGCLLEEEGIPCLISSENNNLSENGYIKDALIAYHKGGIVLFPTDVVEGSKTFTRFARAFGLRYGIIRGYDEDKASEELEDAAEKIRNHPEIRQVPYVQFSATPLEGNELETVAKEYFSDDEELMHLITTSKINAGLIVSSTQLINHISEKEDWSSIRKLLQAVPKTKASGDTYKERQVSSGFYDISIINCDLNPELMMKMARHAKKLHKPFRVLLTGPSGTGKTALAYKMAKELDVPIIVKKPHQIIFRYFGESETAINNAFIEAEEKGALLLFDEVDSYISKKLDATTGGGRAYNDITNCFMQAMESYSGLMVATTNYVSHLDPAFYRRFNKIVDFKFPDEAGMRQLFSLYFPSVDFDEEELEHICRSGKLGPGDFSSLEELTEYMEPEEVTPDFIISSLTKIAKLREASRSENAKTIIGFH